VVKIAHNSCGGHFGSKKVIPILKRNFIWPKCSPDTTGTTGHASTVIKQHQEVRKRIIWRWCFWFSGSITLYVCHLAG